MSTVDKLPSEMFKPYCDRLGMREEVYLWLDKVLNGHVRKRGVLPQKDEVEHILDYLNSDDAPRRLLRMGYDVAKRKADEWVASDSNNTLGSPPMSSKDVEEVYRFSDGSTIVRLISDKARVWEGKAMQNCVKSLKDDNIHSLRDPNGYPHIHFRMYEDNTIRDVNGKANKYAPPKWAEKFISFLKDRGIEPDSSSLEKLGYYSFTDKIRDLIEKNVDPRYIVKRKLFGKEYYIDAGGRPQGITDEEELKDVVWDDDGKTFYAVVLTDHRGVFFGRIRPEDRHNKDIITIFDCQMAVKYWDGLGVIGLCVHGPTKCNITKPIPDFTVHGVSNTVSVTKKAVKKWLKCPWSA